MPAHPLHRGRVRRLPRWAGAAGRRGHRGPRRPRPRSGHGAWRPRRRPLGPADLWCRPGLQRRVGAPPAPGQGPGGAERGAGGGCAVPLRGRRRAPGVVGQPGGGGHRERAAVPRDPERLRPALGVGPPEERVPEHRRPRVALAPGRRPGLRHAPGGRDHRPDAATPGPSGAGQHAAEIHHRRHGQPAAHRYRAGASGNDRRRSGRRRGRRAG